MMQIHSATSAQELVRPLEERQPLQKDKNCFLRVHTEHCKKFYTTLQDILYALTGISRTVYVYY